ncbi:MAG: hypothetical protein IPO19_00755 [Rhodoferax sp.]|nr:hypothetical protein [Rhodoferax sp.]
MRVANELTIRALSADGDIPQSELLRDGVPVGQRLPGAVLEAAVQWRDHYLLFVTDDVPYEEALHIVLLDEQWRTVDCATMGGPYTTGSFSALSLLAPSTVRFRFIGDTDWELELLSGSVLRIPLLGDPRGVTRPHGFTRRFVLRGEPKPQSHG